MLSDPVQHFPADYRSARKAFVTAAEAAHADVVTRVHPFATAPEGKPLFLDTAVIGPRGARSALLLISATHGVEGYFGSGVQAGLLREGVAGRVPEGAKVVML